MRKCKQFILIVQIISVKTFFLFALSASFPTPTAHLCPRYWIEGRSRISSFSCFIISSERFALQAVQRFRLPADWHSLLGVSVAVRSAEGRSHPNGTEWLTWQEQGPRRKLSPIYRYQKKIQKCPFLPFFFKKFFSRSFVSLTIPIWWLTLLTVVSLLVRQGGGGGHLLLNCKIAKLIYCFIVFHLSP